MNLDRALEKAENFQDSVVERVGWHSRDMLYYSFAFVFFYFGIQKPAPVISPPRYPVGSALAETGIPLQLETVILIIGLYEVMLGALFFFKKIKLVFWPFLIHQATGFATLMIVPFEVFQPPWIEIGPLSLPWYLDGFSAFVLKNLIFVSAFFLLYQHELQRAETEEK